MSNNRMYLRHRPTGQTIMIAKRMAWGWYSSINFEDKADTFFDWLKMNASEQDDFHIVLEVLDKKTSAPKCEAEIIPDGDGGYENTNISLNFDWEDATNGDKKC